MLLEQQMHSPSILSIPNHMEVTLFQDGANNNNSNESTEQFILQNQSLMNGRPACDDLP